MKEIDQVIKQWRDAGLIGKREKEKVKEKRNKAHTQTFLTTYSASFPHSLLSCISLLIFDDAVKHQHIPGIFEQERCVRRVLNSTEGQKQRLRYLQGMTGNDGTEADLEAAVFTLELNVVLILTLSVRTKRHCTDNIRQERHLYK